MLKSFVGLSLKLNRILSSNQLAGMATLSIGAGFTVDTNLQNCQIIFAGPNKHLKALKLDAALNSKLMGVVNEDTFQLALRSLPSTGGSVPLYLDYARIVSIPDEASRHNSPSNAQALFNGIKGVNIVDEVKKLCVVLFCEYSHVMASVSAISKCFPLFSRKTAPKKEESKLESVVVEVIVTDEKKLTDGDIKFLQSLSESIRMCCMLVDTPANELHTEAFATESITMVDNLGVPIQKTVIKGEELRSQGFGGIYSVGKAAAQPPIFACFSHTPANAKESYALVGKGIVFDTGGMQIKTSSSMLNMKKDMGGAAACLGAFITLVKSGFRENLHCLLCIAENNISPLANKPDDVITLLSGKSVEVKNTDAEGRLVLADGVFYAKTKLNAKTIIDVATLTGAQAYATGKLHGAILSNREDLEIECLKAGRKSGDLVHALPYAPDLHFEDLKSAVADMSNVEGCGKYVGPPSSTAGLFIAKHIDFSDSINWLHIDIAAPAWSGNRATGFGTSLLVSLLSKHASVDVALAKEICEPLF